MRNYLSKAGFFPHRWRVRFQDGEAFLSKRNHTRDKSRTRRLADALPERSFKFCQWDALLLICGEVAVVRGRNHVEFCRSIPQELQDALRAKTAMILNPTHTRMANCGTLKAWRQYLSSGGRLYVSASNWDLAKGQRQSETLHSLWHDGQRLSPTYTIGTDHVCYREWAVPLVQALRH